ncbi:interleukin 17a/f2 [Fundulus heteroclitus]|uniref:Interleukin-17A-like n=1 Tax=Fundulus heteroclitus TaxID=8078 RepID=A0A3Q2QM83_FUNHE|nr:interleukin 17a/f2 [Fundulus heteroclitus]XP_021167503.1 interleukin 17a/f2 [Fundulus heteroclitus]
MIRTGPGHSGDNMQLLTRSFQMLLVFCSALWVASSEEQVPPALCDSVLVFSSDVSSSEGRGSINLRSLSPWTWRTTTVKNQIPSTIWEANCTSEFCSAPKPGQAGNHNLNSVPIYQNILVLTRMSNRCYSASYRSVAVGCTCVRATTDQN